MRPREHKVYLPREDELVLTVGSCTCGWRLGYDSSMYGWAVRTAEDHCVEQLEAELEAGPEAGPEWTVQ